MKPWSEWVKRLIIHVPRYLEYDGQSLSLGGRERYVRDVAELARELGWSVVIVQKGSRAFRTHCPYGFEVIGHRVPLGWRGDALLSYRVKSMQRAEDAVLHAAAEEGAPFFARQAKGIQHGIWWDAPFPWFKRWVAEYRALSPMRSLRSMLCVDTNFINWLRCRGTFGVEAAGRCVYIPNYADETRIQVRSSQPPQAPFRLLFVRRFEHKRGPWLFLEAVQKLRSRGLLVTATMCTVGGGEELSRWLAQNGLSEAVTLRSPNFEEVLETYQHHDLTVVPTLWSEGTSMAAVESIVAGVPVVTTPVGGLANLIIPGFNGDIATPEVDSLAESIERLLSPAKWSQAHQGCLSLRGPLGKARWTADVRDWLAG